MSQPHLHHVAEHSIPLPFPSSGGSGRSGSLNYQSQLHINAAIGAKEGRKEEGGLRLRLRRILYVIGGASLFNSIEAERTKERNARTGRVEVRTPDEADRK